MSSSRVVLPLALAVTALVGCSFSANLTVTGPSVAEAAEDALEAEIGRRPAIDCGEENVPLADDTEVECELTDEESGTTYDAVVTISGVDGTDYRIDVQVGEVPTSGAASDPQGVAADEAFAA